MKKAYYAVIEEDNSGPAFGIGANPEMAWKEAVKWGIDDRKGFHLVRITRASFQKIQGGNPDAVNIPCE